LVIINEVHERRLCTFAFGTGLSYKLSKDDPHLTEFKDLIDSFQFEFYVVYFKLIYSVCCSELSASQDFPRLFSPDSFPLLSSPESIVIEVFLVSVFHVRSLVSQFPQLNVFVVMTLI